MLQEWYGDLKDPTFEEAEHVEEIDASDTRIDPPTITLTLQQQCHQVVETQLKVDMIKDKLDATFERVEVLRVHITTGREVLCLLSFHEDRGKRKMRYIRPLSGGDGSRTSLKSATMYVVGRYNC